MGKYALPIHCQGNWHDDVVDANNTPLPQDDIARDLTEFYTLKAMQEECAMARYMDDDGAIRDLQKRDWLTKREIITVLNAYDALLKRQDECGKTGHLRLRDNKKNCDYPVCVKCGKDLRVKESK